MVSKTEKLNIEIVDKMDEWQLLLDKLKTSNTYMKWSWGNYKKKSGWVISNLKIVSSDSKQLVGCCLLQTRIKWFVNIYLIQGGVHLSEEVDKKDVNDCIYEALCSYIKKNNNLPWLLLINYQSQNLDASAASLMKMGFSPILTKKMFTFLVFNNNFDSNLLLLSQNWRHNLKRAKKNDDLKIEWVSSYKDRVKAFSHLAKMYGKLTNRKKFKSGIDLNDASDVMAKDQSIIVVQAKLHGVVVAIRVASVCNDHLLDLFAASNEGAKKCYANYLLMWEIIMKMKELNKKFFDTGGIDPESNIGVYNFKKGLNGRLTINGPLWCLGSNPLLERTTRMFFYDS